MAETSAVQQAVERALSEALGSIQRQLGEVQSSFDQVKGALETAGNQTSGDRFVTLLPPLMHMQAAGAALAASIETVLRFVGISAQWIGIPAMAAPVSAAQAAAAPPPPPAPAYAEAPAGRPAAVAAAPPPAVEEVPVAVEEPAPVAAEAAPPAPVVEAPPPPAPVVVDVESLPAELQELHKKAKRFAKITVQELVLYHKDAVAKGRENKDLYQRLKDDIDKSKALYDKRYERIAGHNIDYLYDELVRVLAENDPTTLGDYPYPRPSSRS